MPTPTAPSVRLREARSSRDVTPTPGSGAWSTTLMPGGKTYSRELGLARLPGGMHVATWIAMDGRGKEQVCCRAVHPGHLGPVTSANAVHGGPALPQVYGHRLLWCEYANARGTLLWAGLDPESGRIGTAAQVAPLAGANCGRFAGTLDASGTLWVVAEIWLEQNVLLKCLSYANRRWKDHGTLGGESGFRVRPRVFAGARDTLIAWDEYSNGRYFACTAQAGAPPVIRRLPTSPPSWESFCNVACTNDGTWYAARCREKLVSWKHDIAMPSAA